jgi:hypothetical protein
MRIHRNCTALIASLALPGAAGAASADGRIVGEVTAVAGEATAQQPGEEPRALHCGDPVYESDRLATGGDSALGVMMGDVLTNLADGTALRVGLTPAGTPDATLELGKVRVIDARDGGAPGRLAVLDARASIAGTDTEAYLFSEKTGPYAMLCEWDSPLSVDRADERAVASPGNCVISKKTEPLYVAKSHDKRIPALANQVCEIDPALLAALAGAPGNHLSPADVSAPGPATTTAGLGAVAPGAGGNPVQTGCDLGGTCGVPTPAQVVVPQPGGGVSLQ